MNLWRLSKGGKKGKSKLSSAILGHSGKQNKKTALETPGRHQHMTEGKKSGKGDSGLGTSRSGNRGLKY